MNKTKFAILGAGFGERVMRPCINFNKNMNVKYIFCRNQNKIKNKKILSKVTNNYEEILNDKEVDIVCIETPPSTHKFFVMEAIKKNKGIICEKPLGLNLREAKLMAKTVKKKKLFACVNHQLRFYPNIVKMKQLLDKKYLGKINYISINHHTDMIDEKNDDNWWFNEKLAGGQLYALGSHLVDLIQFLNGKIRRLTSCQGSFTKMKKFKKMTWKKKIDTYFATICEFSNGSLGTINASCITNVDNGLNITVSGEKRTLKLINFENLFLYDSHGLKKNISVKDKLKPRKVIGLNPWRTSQVYYLKHINLTFKTKKNFLGASFEDGLETQKILKNIFISSREKKFKKI